MASLRWLKVIITQWDYIFLHNEMLNKVERDESPVLDPIHFFSLTGRLEILDRLLVHQPDVVMGTSNGFN